MVRSRRLYQFVARCADMARWMGHKDIHETFVTYSHFMPEAEDRGVTVLDAEYAEWSAARIAPQGTRKDSVERSTALP